MQNLDTASDLLILRMKMNRYLIAVAILCGISFVNCIEIACTNANQALADNAACLAAFGSIATSGSDSPACSGACRSLIEDVLDNCADEVQYLLNI